MIQTKMSGLSDTIDSMGVDIIIATLFIFVMVVLYVSSVVKNRKLKKRIKVLAIALTRVEELAKSKKEDEEDNDVHKENFIKFLSDSRDWAYLYIEDVQTGLTEFVNQIEPEIAYFDEYGIIGEAYPHYHSMKKISQEYKKIKKFLPTEE